MKLLFLIFPMILVGCVTSSTPKGETLPVLGNPARAAAWGTPSVSKTPDGYQMVYQNPANRKEQITIIGSRNLTYGLSYPPNIKGQKTVGGKTVKTSTPQVWQKVQIVGKNAYFYQSHEAMDGRNARYKTLGEELTDPRGVFGYYAVDAEGSNNQVRGWISELRFGR